MLRKLLSFFKREAKPVEQRIEGEILRFAPLVVNVEHDIDEIAERVAAKVMAGIKAEIAKAKRVSARPKVAVKKK